MPSPLKRILFIIGGAGGLLVIIVLASLLLVDINHYKPRLELAASNALGMDVRIRGRLSLGLFPGLHVMAEDGQVLDGRGVAVASAKRTSLWVDLLPLLHKELRLHRVELTRPHLFVVRDSVGSFDVGRLKSAVVLLAALDGADVSVLDGSILYADSQSAERFEATDLNLRVSRVRLARGTNPQPLKGLSLQAEITCGRIRAGDLLVSALRASVRGKDGVFVLEPGTMRVFGGEMVGSIHADLSGPVPLYQVRCSLPHFRIEEFLTILSPKRAAQGAMGFSAGLSMQGETVSQMVQTTAGAVSLRGEDLLLVDNDLDRRLSRFESSQSFNLVDVGAVFFAGPLGLAVTKGYNFASLFRGSGGTSRVHTVVSDWTVERGVAQAKDVAMATSENRIALRGGLDFVNGRFADVTVAVIDAKGCARVRQVIRGSFGRPVVEKPRVLASLAGPVLKLYKQTRRLFPAAPCVAFYSGSVAAPR